MKVCVANNPPSSSAVTVTVADPYSTGTSVSTVPETIATATDGSDDIALYAVGSPSTSVNNGVSGGQVTRLTADYRALPATLRGR